METTRNAEDRVPGRRRVGTRTHIGLKRELNEDYLGVEETPHGLLLVVCDGMGGHEAGERASRLAVDTFVRAVADGAGAPRELLRDAVLMANKAVYDESGRPATRAGMGTTLVAALVDGDRAIVVNVGDSRAYLQGSDGLRRVTSDHSMVGELVAQGKITEAQARVHPQRNIITRAVGTRPDIDPDFYDLTLRDGDQLLLATDGLTGMVDDPELERILHQEGSPERICDKLIDAALAGGGDDNVTVALLAVGERRASARQFTEPDTDPTPRAFSAPGAAGAAAFGAADASEASARDMPAAEPPRRGRSHWLLPLVILTLGVAVWYFWADAPHTEVDTPAVDSLLRTATDSTSELDGLIDTMATPAPDRTFDSLIRLHTEDTISASTRQSDARDSMARRDSIGTGDAVTGRGAHGAPARRR